MLLNFTNQLIAGRSRDGIVYVVLQRSKVQLAVDRWNTAVSSTQNSRRAMQSQLPTLQMRGGQPDRPPIRAEGRSFVAALAGLFGWLLLAGYLLFAHGCHANEDTELLLFLPNESSEAPFEVSMPAKIYGRGTSIGIGLAKSRMSIPCCGLASCRFANTR